MSVIISQIRGELNESHENVIKRALKKTGISEGEVFKKDIYKTSLDARKRYTYGVFCFCTVER